VNSFLQKSFGAVYRRWIRSKLSSLQQQRFKLLFTVWGYRLILSIKTISLKDRVRVILNSIAVDWNVQHGHWPGEIARVMATIGERKARPGEVIVEAGCWKGGSTAKFSLICEMLQYKLFVFDSFQGVEYIPGNSFSGQYAADLDLVKKNVASYGNIDVCEFVSGWFADTLAGNIFQHPVRVAYLDCDLAKGTHEVLQGLMPSYVDDGVICSQDYHIGEVQALLDSDDTWQNLGVSNVTITDRFRNLVVFRFRKNILGEENHIDSSSVL